MRWITLELSKFDIILCLTLFLYAWFCLPPLTKLSAVHYTPELRVCFFQLKATNSEVCFVIHCFGKNDTSYKYVEVNNSFF